jgi:enamine deaminase RidA (YjgF/YER057c/UK114 family)
VRQEFFGDTRPASTLVEVSRLAVPGARLEIEAIAHLDDRFRTPHEGSGTDHLRS